jgi:N-methylhydantoinase B/oxoprolinase/acetone carboxylase alpha subunit
MLPVTTTKPETLKRDDVFRHLMAGGVGFGPPHERDPARVLADVRADPPQAAGCGGVAGMMAACGARVRARSV